MHPATLKGYTAPLTPRGEASLVPAPPWHYSGEVIAIEFWIDRERVEPWLPPRLALEDAGRVHGVALFADWQFTARNDEFLDPARYQFREFCLLIDALYHDNAVAWCPLDFVDNDCAIGRGMIQGHPRKLGSIHQTRTFAAPSLAAAPVASGTRFGASVSTHGLRLAEARVTLHQSMSKVPAALRRPTVVRRYFPRLRAGQHDKPAVDELTMSLADNLIIVDVWNGSAELIFPEARGEELQVFQPERVGRGYRFSMSCSIRDQMILEDFAASATG